MGKQVKQPVQAGKSYEFLITGVGHSGEGVARWEGFTVFIPYALPGEQVTAVITIIKKNYAIAQLEKVAFASPDRIEPPCSIYYRCGGCQLQHISYAGQLRLKYQQVQDAIERIGKLTGVQVKQVLAGRDYWHYRNKMQFPIGKNKKGAAVIGCYAAGTHAIIDTENCLIQDEANNLVAKAMKNIINELDISVYDEVTGKGILRHILGRTGKKTGQIMAVIVTATMDLPKKEQIISGLRQLVPGLCSICHNVNNRRTNVVLGNKTTTLWGKDTITDSLEDLNFRISPHSFFQVNTVQAALLYTQARKYAGLTGKEIVIDAYCGTGTITLFLAKYAARVYGIEIVTSAVNDAIANAKDNNIENVEFIAGDTVEIMPALYQQGIKPDVIIVDPPRAGCATIVLETFSQMEPTRIVYISCNPASLARDLAVLAKLGYQCDEVQPVDMFHHTSHVECVALIQRRTM